MLDLYTMNTMDLYIKTLKKKRLQNSRTGKIHHAIFMGKSTISIGPWLQARNLNVYQRVECKKWLRDHNMRILGLEIAIY